MTTIDSSKAENRFRYTRSPFIDGVTFLNAQMHDFSYDKHAHEEFSFGVTLSGRQDFFCSRSFHKSAPGNIIIFNPEEVHDGQPGGDDTLKYGMLYIHPEQLFGPLAAAGAKQPRDFRLTDTLFNDVQLRHNLLALMSQIDQGNTLEQDAHIHAIAARLAQLEGQYLPNQTTRKSDRLIQTAKSFVQASFQQDITIEDIAQTANMSKYHFIRLFRTQQGITPHQYVINCRVNYAKRRLEKGDDINTIALDSGFSDVSHLNRRFKPFFGLTPKQYQMAYLATR
ncbi:AraC family transcriptional regulator [Thaumasiovibrio subtropicus]|uniref:AraC family transcriptional regulator n=1 Tax=Thaumasiovibrio subtropicus TaxID=1891207 RepID=UPI000B34AF90|nr:AraC family transcriptional regulator [Thaumasiovibrio subtropicus]